MIKNVARGLFPAKVRINEATKEYLETARFVIGKRDEIFDDWLLLASYNHLLVYVYVITFVYAFSSLRHVIIDSRHSKKSWWRHQMETFSALLAICAGNSPVPMNSPLKRQWRFDVCIGLCLNKRLSKQWWGWWFETPSRSIWRHCNVYNQQTSEMTLIKATFVCNSLAGKGGKWYYAMY